MKIVLSTLVLVFMAGCTFRLCNCYTDERTRQTLDGNNSTNIEFELTPS